MTDKSHTTTASSTSEPIVHSANMDIPKRSSIFGSLWGTLSGSPNNTTRPNNEYAISPPSSATGSSLSAGTVKASSLEPASRPRRLSQQGISADEAFNLARANSRKAEATTHGRRASKGRLEGMGLVAAFSGGPSSF